MKKVIILGLLILLCGCTNNKMITDDYIKKNDYDVIYQELKDISYDVSYYPTDKSEQKFFEMIKGIKNNYQLFTKDELTNLYNLMNNKYEFKYNLNVYDNEQFNNDLQEIYNYITE